MGLKKETVRPARTRASNSTRAARLSPAERREQLLACAVRTFADRGFSAANHATVAAAAGVAVPTVFLYFANRDALLSAVLDEVEAFYRRTVASAIGGDKPADATLLELTGALTHTLGTHADYARILREWSVSVHEPVWPRYLKHYRRMVRVVAAVIRRGQREGSIRADVNATDEAELLYAGASTALTQMMEVGASPERIHRLMRVIVQTVLLPTSSALRNQVASA